ncbi:MAG: ShlB/FhaC/HecB family hemolysin secretion/activation protein [Rubrivivax sp.]
MHAACWLLVGLAAPALAQVARVPINEFVVTGNTLLPPETLNAALAPYKGERTLDELKQAALAVQALYRDAGYGAVIAYVPEQRGAPGRATIAVLEGRIARVEVVGNSQFSADNIRRSLPALTVGSTPQVRRLDTQIRLANENPAKRLALTLEPGQQAGEVDARVLVVEQSPSLWTVAVDNTGNDSTGMFRGYLRYQQAALWDLDHVLSLQVGTSLTKPASAVSIGGNYRIPMYEHGMTADIFAAYSDADGGNTFTAAGTLRFNGSGEVLGALLTKHLERWGDFDQQLGFGLDLRLYLNNCDIVGLPAGACGSSGESVTVNPLSIAYTAQKSGKNPAGFSLGFSQNLGLAGPNGNAANFDAVRAGAEKYYTLLRLAGYATLPLPDQWQLQGRVSGQLTPDALIPGEQFGIAGANTVRGYLEREVIGDRGVVGSVELYAPALLEPMGVRQSMLQLLTFVDAGKVWNHLDTPCVGTASSCPLASVGLGIRAGLQALQLRLDVAYALKDGNSTTAGDTRASFLATYNF